MSFGTPARTHYLRGDGRLTAAYSPPAPPREDLALKHTLTGSLGVTSGTSSSSGASGEMAKKVAVARMITSNLMRQYGDRPGAEAVIEAEVRGAVLDTTARVTPDRVHEMESRIRAKFGVPGPGSGGSTGRLSGGAGRGGSAPSTGGTTKSLTAAGRSLAKQHPGSAGVSPAGESPDAWFASGGDGGKSSGRGSRDEGSSRRALDFGADSLMMTSPSGAGGSGRMMAGSDTFGRSVSSPALRAGGSPAVVSGTASRAAAPGAGAASRFDRDATSSGPASPAVLESLSTLKSYVAADPEPEKVLGLVDEVRAELQAKRERAAAQAKAAAIRADHAADEAAKAERKALEHGVEQMWKKVTEATVGEMASREEAERAAARTRHAEEGRVRAAQVAASHTFKTREKAEQLAWEKFQLKLSLEQVSHYLLPTVYLMFPAGEFSQEFVSCGRATGVMLPRTLPV